VDGIAKKNAGFDPSTARVKLLRTRTRSGGSANISQPLDASCKSGGSGCDARKIVVISAIVPEHLWCRALARPPVDCVMCKAF